MKFYLGVDGGGTQTRAVVMNDTLEVVGRGTAGPGNHYRVGPVLAAEHCRQAAQNAMFDAARLAPDFQREDVAAWGFGLAGVRRNSDAQRMRLHLEAVARCPSWVLDTDAAAAHSGALNGAPGIVLIAGTGAICFAIDEEGERFYGDGWGPVLGDEGSSYWIGQEALKAICRAHDGRTSRTHLSGPVLNALGVADMEQLVPAISSGEMTPDRIAGLARVIMDAAQNGVATAIDIRERAVGHLGLTTAAVAHKMLARIRERAGMNNAEPVELLIALHGGLFEDDHFRASVGYSIGEHMVEMKRDFLPLAGWKIVKPQFDAAFGAALLAQKHAGLAPTFPGVRA
jgi:N-acetylglucosamine kinase-like BadF-type ATPase